jgi:hypothetical protein
MTKPPANPQFESAHEEFARRVKELYELADKMGLRLSIGVKPKGQPNASQREPGEN